MQMFGQISLNRALVLAAAIAVVFTFSSCGKQSSQQAQQAYQAQGTKIESFINPHDSRADSLVLAAYREADYQHLLVVIDSLSAAGELKSKSLPVKIIS